MQNRDLLAITAAPFAEREVKTQTDPCEKRGPAVEHGRLQAGDLLAIRRQVAKPSGEDFDDIMGQIHKVLRRRVGNVRPGLTAGKFVGETVGILTVSLASVSTLGEKRAHANAREFPSWPCLLVARAWQSSHHAPSSFCRQPTATQLTG